MHSKSKIDVAGKALAENAFRSEDHELESLIIFDDYRRAHLQPLTEATMRLQDWLAGFDRRYYIAQRLKRKPQILRKMKRFSARLTQLQDIGGNRVIVDTNEDVTKLQKFLKQYLDSQDEFKIHRETDYRIYGRDDSGYRALHIILKGHGVTIELQLRSQAQHYWAESIERTSVIYGHLLKEMQGDINVLKYFKYLSRIFHDIESKREPAPQDKIELDGLREKAERIISESDKGALLHSHTSDEVLHTLTSLEQKRPGSINNWILIFDWNTGHFVNWEAISRNPVEAYKAYTNSESQYNDSEGFEVVLVGSSDVSMIRKTHSHYFGIDGYDAVLESLDESMIGFSARKKIDPGCRRILLTLIRKRYWGRKPVSLDTLKNHYCQSVISFDTCLAKLKDLELVSTYSEGGISLNQRKKDEINSYL